VYQYHNLQSQRSNNSVSYQSLRSSYTTSYTEHPKLPVRTVPFYRGCLKIGYYCTWCSSRASEPFHHATMHFDVLVHALPARTEIWLLPVAARYNRMYSDIFPVCVCVCVCACGQSLFGIPVQLVCSYICRLLVLAAHTYLLKYAIASLHFSSVHFLKPHRCCIYSVIGCLPVMKSVCLSIHLSSQQSATQQIRPESEVGTY